MRREQLSVIVALVVLVLWLGVGAAQVENGVQTGVVAGVPAAGGFEASVPGDIDFDDGTQPCNFDQTVALTTEYSGLGVVFSGPGGNDGGAILDECGSFGVSGYSPPNFLAFNTGAVLSNGGIPHGPETLTFSVAVDTVAINGGSTSAGTITLECFDAGAASVGSQSITGASALQPMSVTASGQIASCRLSFTGSVAVFDDLTYNPPIPVELQSLSVD
jgi:hypothetical protein